MDRKVLALLLIFLTGTSLLTLGCADRKNAGSAEPTITPTTPAPTAQASNAPALTPTATVPATSQGQPGMPSSGGLGLDPSFADISGEDNDLVGFPETGLPTPTLD